MGTGCSRTQHSDSPKFRPVNADEPETFPQAQDKLSPQEQQEGNEDKARSTQRGVIIDICPDIDWKEQNKQLVVRNAQLMNKNGELTKQNKTLQKKLKKIEQKAMKSQQTEKVKEHEILRLKNEVLQLQKKNHVMQNRLLDLNPNALSLKSDFPEVEDIVIRYDTLRAQNRTDCLRQIKKYFKKQYDNANAAKYWIVKQANKLLFELLINCHNTMRNYYILVNEQYNNNDIDGLNKVVYLKLREQFQSLFDQVKQEYRKDIVEKQIENKYENIYEFCGKQQFIEYIDECLYICWFINVCKTPPLILHPIVFDKKGRYSYDDNKDDMTDEMLKNNKDNKDVYEYVAGSEETETLNYYAWPAIIRTDKQFALSRIHAFFMDDIPKNKS